MGGLLLSELREFISQNSLGGCRQGVKHTGGGGGSWLCLDLCVGLCGLGDMGVRGHGDGGLGRDGKCVQFRYRSRCALQGA